MQLAWLQYQSNLKSQYYLVLLLLEKEDRYVALVTKDIAADEIERIRRNIGELNKYDIADKIAWFRTNLAQYKRAYREFKKGAVKIDQKFDLKPL